MLIKRTIEDTVKVEIYKSYLNAGKRPPMYFYRDSNKKEIDVILYKDGIINPIEIKKGSAPKDAIKNFSVLNAIENSDNSVGRSAEDARFKTAVGTGAAVCLSSDIIPIDRKIIIFLRG